MNEKNQRKFFRFPAYDDREGVKLRIEHSRRVIFAGNDFLTDYAYGRPGTRNEKPLPTMTTYDTEHLYTNETPANTGTPKLEVINSSGGKTPIERANTSRMAKCYGQKNSVDHIRRSVHSLENEKEFQLKPKESAAETEKRVRNYDLEWQKESSKTVKQRYTGDVDRFRSRRVKSTTDSAEYVSKPLDFAKDELLGAMKKELGNFLLLEDMNTQPALQRKKQQKNSSIPENAPEKRTSRVLNRGLAGVFEEESKGIDKVKNQFFKKE